MSDNGCSHKLRKNLLLSALINRCTDHQSGCRYPNILKLKIVRVNMAHIYYRRICLILIIICALYALYIFQSFFLIRLSTKSVPQFLSIEQTSIGFDDAFNQEPVRINNKDGNKQGNGSIDFITQPQTAYSMQKTQSISYSTSQNSSSQIDGKGKAGMALSQ